MIDYNKLLLAKSSTYNFVTTFFKDPHNLTQPWNPYQPQIDLYNVIDFGYNIMTDDIKPTSPSEILTMVWPRQYGKTEACSSCIAALALRHQKVEIGVVSAGEAMAQEFIERIYYFIDNSPFTDHIVKKKADRIVLSNGSIIKSTPTSEKAIRGNSWTWVFVDEAGIISNQAIDEWIIPTTRSVGAYRKWRTPSIIMLSTPPKIFNRFIEYYTQGLELRTIACRVCGAIHPMAFYKDILFYPIDLPELPDCECGANSYQYVSNDIITVSLNPWVHPTRTRDEIQRELDIRGNSPSARRELLAEIISDDLGVFKSEWLDQCTDHTLHNRIIVDTVNRYVVAADFGKTHDASVITVGHMDKGIITVDYIYYIPSEGGIEYAEIRYKLLNIINIYKPTHLALDATGLGGPIVEDIQNDLYKLMTTGLDCEYKTNGVKMEYHFPPNYELHTNILNNKKNQLGVIFDYKTKVDLVDNLSNLLQRKMIRFPPQYDHPTMKIFFSEMLKYGYKFSNNQRIIYGVQNSHDDTVIGVALLTYGLRSTPYYFSEAILVGEDQYVL